MFPNHKDDAASENEWRESLTRWLQSCKGIQNVTESDFKKWDDIFNSGSATPDDMQSLQKCTGFQWGKPLG
jgi:hypothetical protein